MFSESLSGRPPGTIRPNSSLPPYYPSSEGTRIPSYTARPSVGEECLSRPLFARSPRTGEFTKSNGRISLTLKEQPDHALLPTYAHNDLVTGTIFIQGCESVTEIVLKLYGRLDLAASNGGHQTELVNDTYTVWHNNLRFQCPSTIPFSLIFPSTFKDGENTWPLPPSIRITPPGKPFVYVKCFYTISVLVSTALHPRFSLWRGEKILTVPVKLQSTAYPPRPIMPDTNLLATVKSAPDEWSEILCKVRLKNIHCSLFIPSALVYSVSDIIPFHLQITGAPAVLATLVSTSAKLPAVRVHLMRRVSLFVRGQTQHRTLDIGEGVLSALPPPMEESSFYGAGAAMDWAGVVRCDETVGVGTFDAGVLYIQDYIVVSIPAWKVEHKHSIRFVSHTWVDDPGPGDRM
ncbi:hypothetical protein C8R46DRAFT_361703 [Mycena filopes]|nr:hypothetical protein C8R46DRAFT_361703 [Mycena filopes]